MKEILSSQLDAISGGWQNQKGNGQCSANAACSGTSSSNRSGNGGGNNTQSFLSTNSPYGSGSGASGYWGGSSTMSPGSNGYSGNGTGPGANQRRAGENH